MFDIKLFYKDIKYCAIKRENEKKAFLKDICHSRKCL